ncbi:MAG: hypothetical protein Q4F13_09640 [Pseudomonadota bacterium]|nr:hypothetical protein [Pseudomonadota bacterium]
MTDSDTIQRLDQWRLTSCGLHMRADETEGGKLARLADVVLWLIEEKQLPRKEAVESLCKALEAASPPPALYYAQSGSYAQPADAVKPEALARRRVARYYIAGNPRPAPVPVFRDAPDVSGVPAVVWVLRRRWALESLGKWSNADFFSSAHPWGHGLAVRVADAARLWGWGGEAAAVPDAESLRDFPDSDGEALGQWRLESCGLYMGSGQGDAGKLVRLDRVRRWLMAGDDGLPYEEAGESLLAPLESLTHAELGTWLFVASKGRYARLIADSDEFDPPAMWGVGESDHLSAPEDCGLRGALRHARRCWCESPGNGRRWLHQETLDRLAVPVAKARELWGWGTDAAPADAELDVENLRNLAELVAYRRGPGRGKPWDVGNQRAVLADEVDKRGGKGARGALDGVANELGISRQAVNSQLNAQGADRNASKQASVFNLHKQQKRQA